MSASDAPSAQAVETVRVLINGHWITQAISVIVRLGIPDRLAPSSPCTGCCAHLPRSGCCTILVIHPA